MEVLLADHLGLAVGEQEEVLLNIKLFQQAWLDRQNLDLTLISKDAAAPFSRMMAKEWLDGGWKIDSNIHARKRWWWKPRKTKTGRMVGQYMNRRV